MPPRLPPGVSGDGWRNDSRKLRRFVRYRISALSLCTFARRTLPQWRPPVTDTLMMPAPSASKCLHPQSLLGTGNINALCLNVYFPCPLQCLEALTRTRFVINRVSVTGGRHCGSVRLSNERKSSKEPKSDTRQISNLTRVPLSVPRDFRRQAGRRKNLCGKF